MAYIFQENREADRRAGLEHDELGYMIAPELWNQGYATEVCRFIIDYARENTDFEELYCRIDEKK